MLVRKSFDTSDDYTRFLEWIIEQVVANIPEGIDDLIFHVNRIAMFTLKLFSLTFQDNETYFFTNQDTSSVKSTQRRQITYSKFYKEPKQTKASSSAVDIDKEGKSSNTVFFNVVQNTRQFVRDACNVHGTSILVRSQKVINGLHEQDQVRLHSGKTPLTAYSSQYPDFCKVLGLSTTHNNSLYGRYCSIHTTCEVDGDENEEDDNETPEFTNILSHFPTNCDDGDLFCIEKENDFLGFNKNFVQSGRSTTLSLSTPPTELEKGWKYIRYGGGCFVQFLSEVVQIIRIMDIPFQFLAMALQEDGPSDITPTSQQPYPFEDLSPQEFKNVRYQPLDLSEGEGLKAAILRGDDKCIKPDALKTLLWTYLVHLINESASADKKPVPKKITVEAKELSRWNFKNDSMATLLTKAVVAMSFIYDHKVF